MSWFVRMTHDYSGEDMWVRADTVVAIREKQGKTLVVTTERGFYVVEDAEEIRSRVDSVLIEFKRG